jgi:uncharacterized protein (TIGR03118 family)
MFSISRLRLKSTVLAAVLCISSTALAQRYSQTNLVSDIPGLAAVTDSSLVNPWGIAFGSKTPFWIADNGTGVSTIYKPDGTKLSLTVTIPPPAGTSGTAAPTGTVFNGTTDFVVSGNAASGPAIFLFATEDGTISGWNPNVDLTQAVLVVDNSALSAVYKGLALAETPEGSFLYATNFHDGIVEMYDTKFQLVKTFTDVSVPPGYAPFGIRNIRGKLYVTFALQNDAKHDDVAGPGHGFVDVFDLSGHKLQRLVSRGPLNSPWGLALASANFGKFSNALLVGNFGDGRISGFNLETGAFRGQLLNAQGSVLSINGLWTITFGNGTSTGPTNTLFFSAGINDEADGLFGRLDFIR